MAQPQRIPPTVHHLLPKTDEEFDAMTVDEIKQYKRSLTVRESHLLTHLQNYRKENQRAEQVLDNRSGEERRKWRSIAAEYHRMITALVESKQVCGPSTRDSY